MITGKAHMLYRYDWWKARSVKISNEIKHFDLICFITKIQIEEPDIRNHDIAFRLFIVSISYCNKQDLICIQMVNHNWYTWK